MAGGRRRGALPDEKLGIDYARFSLQKQASIPEQQEINADVAAEHGVRLVARFDDPAVSRSLADREGLLEAFAYLEAHRDVRYIIVNELERLTAGVSQRARVVELCKRLEITILTEDMGAIDPFDEEKMHEADQRAVAGQGEVLKIRRRTRRSLKAKVRSGTVAMRPAFGTRMKPVTGPDGQELPKGTRLVDGQGKKVSSGVLEVEPDELPWLIKMFNWAGEGVADEQIAARLTAAGVTTKNGRSAWRGTTVAGILSNPLYKGEMTWGRQKTVREADGHVRMVERDVDDPERLTFPSPLGPLVDPVLFERVQAMRARRAGGRTMSRRRYGTQLFDGWVYCGRCGHKMYGRNDAAGARDAHRGVIKWRYWCNSKRQGYVPLQGYGEVCQTSNSMHEKKILAALATLTEAEAPALVSVRAAAPEDSSARRRVLLKEIDEIGRQRERAVDLAIRGLLSEGELATATQERDVALSQLRAQLAALETVVPAEINFSTAEQQSLIAELVDLLQDSAIPVEDRREALRNFGLHRLYIDNPRVQIELIA